MSPLATTCPRQPRGTLLADMIGHSHTNIKMDCGEEAEAFCSLVVVVLPCNMRGSIIPHSPLSPLSPL